MLNLVQQSYARSRLDDERRHQRDILRARAYHNGDQFVKLTERLREFLQDAPGYDDAQFLRLNMCRPVITAMTERMQIARFAAGDDVQDALFAEWWQANRMDATQHDLHEATLRDGEAFLVVSYDSAAGRPAYTPHPRYVSADVYLRGFATGIVGDGYGITPYYPDDDDTQAMAYADKEWTERRYSDGKWQTRRRKTRYWPDRIEKYAYRGDGLEQIRDDGDVAWPIPWRARDGSPLGIPVIHVKNVGLRAAAWDAIPLQNLLNKTLIDLAATGDFAAFRVLFARGFYPTTDGKPLNSNASNAWKITPHTVVGTTATDADLRAIDGADMSKLTAVIDRIIYYVAMVTDTPISRFITTGQVASSQTLKEQEAPLVAKIQRRQALIGNAYEDALTLARRLHNTYGGGDLDETMRVAAEWKPAATDDEAETVDMLAVKREKLSVPLEQIWREAGYTDEQIAEMQASPEYAARLAMLSLGANGDGNSSDDDENDDENDDA